MKKHIMETMPSVEILQRTSERINRHIKSLIGIPNDMIECHALAVSQLFDPAYYISEYADIADAGIDPILHYVRHGVGEGRNPNGWFRTRNYAAVKQLSPQVNPLYDFTKTLAHHDNDGKVVTVVFSTNEKYAPFLATSVASIISHSKSDITYEIFVLHLGMEDATISKFKSMETKNCWIKCLDVNFMVQDTIHIMYEKNHFSREMYLRIIIPELFFFKEKILYIDCDTLILRDVSELFNEDVSSCVMGVVSNFKASTFFSEKSMDKIRKIVKFDDSKYFNSGMLLMNVRNYIEQNISQKCFDILLNNSDLFCPDQDILNIACYGKVRLLDYRWNFQWQHLVCNTIDKLRPNDRELYLSAANSPYIIHFTSANKPWLSNKNNFSELFWEHSKLSPFYNDLKHKYASKKDILPKNSSVFK